MRRKIELYIAGTLADLNDQALVLFNYAFSDLQNPAAVKNSWSQQVTLPGTPVNETIFGHYNRVDRTTDGDFNALARTPFTIYADTGEVLQRGYLRLDNVTKQGGIVTGYQVSLFGGLGSFFYGLSYRDDGGKMTLADLDYLTSFDKNELDFFITASTVSTAWGKLAETGLSSIWHVLNFAPAYEGIPEGNFDADKMWGQTASFGLTTPSGYHGTGSRNIYTFVKLARKVTGWEAHDLRSYLQRPVISMRAILSAIKDKASWLGYTFDYSDIPASEYNTLWKTLPTIPSLGTFRKDSGSLVASPTYYAGTAVKVADYYLSGIGSFVGVIIDASIATRLYWYSSSYPTATLNYGTTKASFLFCEMVSYAGSVTQSQVIVIGPDTTTPDDLPALASRLNFTPQAQTVSWSYLGTQPTQPGTGEYRIPGDVIFNLTTTGTTRYTLFVTAYACQGNFRETECRVSSFTGGSSSVVTLYKGDGSAFVPDGGSEAMAGSVSDVFVYSRPQMPRSGAALGKSTLLQSKYSPAEYLIGWAKLQGYVFRFDPATSTVYLERRGTFYGTGLDTIDLSQRIDRSKGVTVRPLNLQAKWYDFGVDVAPGAFAAEYKGTYGRNYGWQRVNTGYEFDSAVQEILAGNPFRAAVSKLAHGPTWCSLNQGKPPFFFEAGHKYTLWADGDNSQKEFDVPALDPSTTKTWYNTTNNGYDKDGITRPELVAADGKSVDGEDILLEYKGTESYARFALSDDSQEMLNANDNKPCWSPRLGPIQTQSIPTFSRYTIASGVVTRSLDFGTPQEVDIPGVSFANGSDLYSRAWALYMADRLDKDTKVLRCHVNFEGIQVGGELMRRFFWYEGSLWVLSKISNYSLTTWDPVECEFVQVKDPSNYTTNA